MTLATRLENPVFIKLTEFTKSGSACQYMLATSRFQYLNCHETEKIAMKPKKIQLGFNLSWQFSGREDRIKPK